MTTEITTHRDEYRRLFQEMRSGASVAHSAFTLARDLAEIEAEQEGLKSGRIVECPNCGIPTPRNLLMTASRGLACADCYDNASDG